MVAIIEDCLVVSADSMLSEEGDGRSIGHQQQAHRQAQYH
jgi:hypothetical protein